MLGAEKNVPYYRNNDIFSIKGFIDNDSSKYNQLFHNYKIVSPGEAIDSGFDYIIMLMENDWDAKIQITYGYGIPEDKVKDKYFFLKLLMTLKYKDTSDSDIIETLIYWKSNELSMFNYHLEPPRKQHQVIWDKKINLPYVELDDVVGKKQRMYFPRNYQFKRCNGGQVLDDILWEQQENSPHLYTFDGHNIGDGDIIVDGGVCEGNFGLMYAEITASLYLFEQDYWWKEANYYTFKNFERKVKYFNKGLSNRSGYRTITLDEVFGDNDKLDFIKMDIEGSEIAALEGAKDLLNREKMKLSICSYHNFEDERIIKTLLSKLGYKTTTSNGLVVFLWDDNIWWNMDFRKGIVYGDK
ncbi:MAG: FkbM family methyltransferase [Lachnospiraceae bacterium]|nr:FkbM family methyltransferase [Lachnospiraceae bacterium]